MSRNSVRFSSSTAPILTALVVIGEQLDELLEVAEGEPSEPVGVLAVGEVQEGLVYEVEVWECSCEPTYGHKLFGDKATAVAYFNERYESAWPEDRVQMRVMLAGSELLCGQFIEKRRDGRRPNRQLHL